MLASALVTLVAPAASAAPTAIYADWASDGTIDETYSDSELRGVLEIADDADLEYYNLEEQVDTAIASGKGGTLVGSKPRKSPAGATLPPIGYDGGVGPGSSNDPGGSFGGDDLPNSTGDTGDTGDSDFDGLGSSGTGDGGGDDGFYDPGDPVSIGRA